MQKKPPLHRLIMGSHAVDEVLQYAPERIVKVYYHESQKTLGRKRSLIEKLKSLNIQVIQRSGKELENLCASSSHQGIVAELKDRPPFNLDGFLENEEDGLVVMLDSINDPHNLGAILRACECFGVKLVVWSKNRGAQLTPVVAKTSVSASELVPICTVSNLAHYCDRFKEGGFHIIGAQVSPGSKDLFNYSFPKRSVLILGSEGEGIRPLLQKKCDDFISIPLFGKIDSLNVSQAAAVCLSSWRRSSCAL